MPVLALIFAAAQAQMPCGCTIFRNGFTTADVGRIACGMKAEGPSGEPAVYCSKPRAPLIRHIDNGCDTGSFRCIADNQKPVFPRCTCMSYSNGASPYSADDLCQETGNTGRCYKRAYVGDSPQGGASLYGCSANM